MKHQPGCPSREAKAERVWDIGCYARHPESDTLLCEREAAHDGPHRATDMRMVTSPGPYGRLGTGVLWARPLEDAIRIHRIYLDRLAVFPTVVPDGHAL